jgi:capsular exopolysaccharide synthesis family protein
VSSVDYWSILRRRWPLIAAFVVVGVIAALVISPDAIGGGERYTATHTLLKENDPDALGLPGERRDSSLGSLRSLVSSNAVAARAADSIGYQGEPAKLAKSVSAVTDPDAGTLQITATRDERNDSERVADAFAHSLLDYLDDTVRESREEEMAKANERITELRTQLADLEARIESGTPAQNRALNPERNAVSRQLSVAVERLETLSEAPLPSDSLSTVQEAEAKKIEGGLAATNSATGRAALAAIVGLLLGAGVALVVDRADTRVRTREDAEEAAGVPVLAEIPPLSKSERARDEVLVAAEPESLTAETFRNLRTSLLLMRGGAAAGSPWDPPAEHPSPAPVPPPAADGSLLILVTSPNPSEGKTTTAANLAATLGETGKRVLVVDADFRHATIHKLFGVPERPGLSDVLAGPRQPSDLIARTNVPGVAVVAAGVASGNGRSHPAELIGNAGRAFLEEARRVADVVVVDTAPILAINDATELAPFVDAVALVCRAGQTTRSSLSRAAEILFRLGAPLHGVVLVGAADKRGSRGYYGYYYRQRTRP